jgi:hypothetical protein
MGSISTNPFIYFFSIPIELANHVSEAILGLIYSQKFLVAFGSFLVIRCRHCQGHYNWMQ